MRPDPAESLARELLGQQALQRLCVQNQSFFSPQAENNGESAFIFLYYAVLRKARQFAETKRDECFLNLISDNNYEEYGAGVFGLIGVLLGRTR